MRALFLLVLGVFLSGCGESPSATQRPEVVRQCGELEGVEPVDPVIVGEYPIFLGEGGMDSCPIITPVPCTKPVAEYVDLCGAECTPKTAAGADGDAWLVGCAWTMRGTPCGGPDYNEDHCVVDPNTDRTYWIHVNECDSVFLPMWLCWSDCGEERIEPPAEWCS